MKYRRLLLTLSLLVPVSFSATAASVVMVQFGSFETNDEAQKRLSAIKTSHADALGALPASVREVKLPPDNLTVYRTQAGPLANRTDAQALCSKLAGSGDECYVVETAVPGTAVAANTTSPVDMAVGAATTAVAVPVTTAMAAAPTLPAAPSFGTPAAPVVKYTPPAQTSVAAPTVALASAGPALAPLSTAPGASSDMQTALDRAAANQTATENAPVVVQQAPAAKPGFWSRVNPFSSSAAPAPKPTPTPDVTPLAEPVGVVTSTTLAGSTPPAPPAPPLPPQPTITASNTIVMPPTDASPMPRLLPPPPPLTAQDKKFLEANGVPPASITPAPVPPAPAIQQPVSLGTTPVVVPPAPPIMADGGAVRVDEAKRVPLSAATTPAAPVAAAVPAVSLMPSATVGQKTLWAQIGQFRDVQSALNFWDSYRQTHPDFPATRVRVASSLQQQYHGNNKLWLRVGPFARDGFVNTLCDHVRAQPSGGADLRCGLITDTGVAAEASSGNTGYLNGSRYNR